MWFDLIGVGSVDFDVMRLCPFVLTRSGLGLFSNFRAFGGFDCDLRLF